VPPQLTDEQKKKLQKALDAEVRGSDAREQLRKAGKL
jgi:hypothetical protein